MEDRLIVTASPHIRDASTTRGLMGNVVIALLPAVLAAGLIFGVQALVLVAVTTLACVAFEYIYEKLLKKSNTVGDLSAVVTGIILALNMPVGMPLWIAVVGAFVAIVITKQLFGGLGYNFANPALVGRIVLFLGFTSRMTAYVYPDMAVDALAEDVDYSDVDMVILPGGIPGTPNLAENKTVTDTCVSFARAGKKVAAICAAPSVLASLGLLEGRNATAHAGFQDKLAGAIVHDEEVVVDGNITTSYGLGGAIPFALELVRQLAGPAEADRIQKAIAYRH